MALGGALFEEIKFANGKILNPRLFRLPRAALRRRAGCRRSWFSTGRTFASAGAGETPLVPLAPSRRECDLSRPPGFGLRYLPMMPNGLPVQPLARDSHWPLQSQI